MISNPTKAFTVDKSISDVKSIMKRIPEFSRCKIKSQDDIVNEYEFDFSTLMIGNIITVSLNEKSETKTEIKLESKRVMGAYDTSIEVTAANLDLKSITNAISALIKDPNAKTEQQIRIEKSEEAKKIKSEKLANMTPGQRKKRRIILFSTIATSIVLLILMVLFINNKIEERASIEKENKLYEDSLSCAIDYHIKVESFNEHKYLLGVKEEIFEGHEDYVSIYGDGDDFKKDFKRIINQSTEANFYDDSAKIYMDSVDYYIDLNQKND